MRPARRHGRGTLFADGLCHLCPLQSRSCGRWLAHAISVRLNGLPELRQLRQSPDHRPHPRMSAFALTREERRLRRVSKDERAGTSWFETAQLRLLTMRDRPNDVRAPLVDRRLVWLGFSAPPGPRTYAL